MSFLLQFFSRDTDLISFVADLAGLVWQRVCYFRRTSLRLGESRWSSVRRLLRRVSSAKLFAVFFGGESAFVLVHSFPFGKRSACLPQITRYHQKLWCSADNFAKGCIPFSTLFAPPSSTLFVRRDRPAPCKRGFTLPCAAAQSFCRFLKQKGIE